MVHNYPYVGQYLYDNPRNGISIVSLTPLEHSLIQVVEVEITNSGDYLEASSNVIPLSSPARFVFIRAPASPPHLTSSTPGAYIRTRIVTSLQISTLQTQRVLFFFPSKHSTWT